MSRSKVPATMKNYIPTEEERVQSLAVLAVFQDKVIRKNTLNTILDLKDTVEFVQNLLNTILSTIETLKNLFEWTSPGKVSLHVYILFLYNFSGSHCFHSIPDADQAAVPGAGGHMGGDLRHPGPLPHPRT